MKKYSAVEKLRIINLILQKELSAIQAELDYGITTRTIRNWKKEFSGQGLRGLERKNRSDKGKYRWLPQELVEFTKALTLHKPPLTISFIHRKVSQEAIRKSIQPISYRTVYNIVKKVNPALVTLAQEGSKAYDQKYELIYRRECHRANEIWQADHTLLVLQHLIYQN